MCYKVKLNVSNRLILKDPHHDDILFVCVREKFYKKGVMCEQWQPVKRPHITPERVVMYYELLKDDKYKGVE
jgi:hypothetical protein